VFECVLRRAVSDDEHPLFAPCTNLAQPGSHPGNHLCVAFAAGERLGYGTFPKGSDPRDGTSRELTVIAFPDPPVADYFNC
jgi:hypothetical protein